MILGVGIDQCMISRMAGMLERYEARFSGRYFPSEVRYCNAKEHRKTARFAMLFAGKEAASKALGTGFRQGVSFSTIEIKHLPSGQPTLKFHRAAQKRLDALCPKGMQAMAHISLTDEGGLAGAMVVISAVSVS